MRTRLVIDDNTVYEIDEDCLEHLRRKELENKNRQYGRVSKPECEKKRISPHRYESGEDFPRKV